MTIEEAAAGEPPPEDAAVVDEPEPAGCVVVELELGVLPAAEEHEAARRATPANATTRAARRALGPVDLINELSMSFSEPVLVIHAGSIGITTGGYRAGVTSVQRGALIDLSRCSA
ncbi:MAG: hypothetical protein WAM97_21800 [Acidimicrobiales bacterium]